MTKKICRKRDWRISKKGRNKKVVEMFKKGKLTNPCRSATVVSVSASLNQQRPVMSARTMDCTKLRTVNSLDLEFFALRCISTPSWYP